MNIRRIVMMMLVLGCLVQGVSALDPIILHASIPPGSYGSISVIDELIYPSEYQGVVGNVTYFASVGSSNGTCWPNPDLYVMVSAGGIGSPVSECDVTYQGPNYETDTLPYTMPIAAGSKVNALAQMLTDYGGARNLDITAATITAIYSFEPVYLASGEACTGSGIFDIYVEDNFAYSFGDGNYSFDLTKGINYSIYYNTADEWHNFTATASDLTWNPTCTLPSISGTITALDGEGIYNLNVTLHDFYLYERDLVYSTFTDTNGSYNFYINDSDDAGPYALSVSGYCNAGADCSTFRIEAPINPGGESYVFDYTWHIPQNVRVDLQYENGSAIPGALLNIKNLPGDVGAWKTTATDGYTTYTSMQSSKIYVDYHGGDTGEAGSDSLHSFQLTPNGQYRSSQFTVTIPDDFANNTTIPVIPPPVVDDNKTDITDMVGDSLFLVTVVDSETSTPLKDVSVTAVAADKINYTGQWTGYTNGSGQWSFSKNNTVGQYDVSVGLTCYLPQTITRYSSASFDLVYSCGAPPGTDDNGTGGWQNGSSNWTYNGTLTNDNDMKKKVSSLMYLVLSITFFILLATYFIKK